MADLNAVPSVPGNQQIQIYFGGMFDQTQMGAPIYFWIIFTLGMILILFGIFVVYHRYFILNKIWGFVECYKSGKPLALIRTRYRKAYLKPLKYVAQLFIDEEGPDKWFAPALETSQSISGVNLIDCVDYFDWLQDPILNQTIQEIVFAWNEDHEDEHDKIHDPITFQKLLGDGKLKDYFDTTEVATYSKGMVKVPAFFVVDISKVEQYLPRTRSSAMFGGYTQWLADNVNTAGKPDWKTWVLPIAMLMTAEIIVAIIAYMILRA
jgi:hypothetical protein